eukprot:320929-Rhodomonas_salina.1
MDAKRDQGRDLEGPGGEVGGEAPAPKPRRHVPLSLPSSLSLSPPFLLSLSRSPSRPLAASVCLSVRLCFCLPPSLACSSARSALHVVCAPQPPRTLSSRVYSCSGVRPARRSGRLPRRLPPSLPFLVRSSTLGQA